MSLLCNDCVCKGKTKELWCKHTKELCMFIRFCSLNRKYQQTDGAATCKLKGTPIKEEDNE